MEAEITVSTSQPATEVISLIEKSVEIGQLDIRFRKESLAVQVNRHQSNRPKIPINELLKALELALSIYTENEEKKKKELKEEGNLGKRLLETPKRKSKKKQNYANKRQKKWTNIVDSYKLQSYHSKTEYVKQFRCSYKTLKNVLSFYTLSGKQSKVSSYYEDRRMKINNILNNLINKEDQIYFSCSSLKRELSNIGLKVSKLYISKYLKKKGFRWLSTKIKSRSNKYSGRDYNLDELHSVISLLTEAVLEKEFVVVFMDEIIFPLQQQADKIWRKGIKRKKLPQRMTSNVSLYCDVSASYNGLLTMEIFQKQLTTKDFYYFLAKTHNLVCQLYPDKKIVYFCDRASWHQGPIIKETSLFKLIVFNQPGLYQINHIEQLFSLVRYLFRSRRIVKNLSEEILSIYHLMMESNTRIKDSSFEKNHVRSLLEMLKRFWDLRGSRKMIKRN